jgi:hypothetical protein
MPTSVPLGGLPFGGAVSALFGGSLSDCWRVDLLMEVSLFDGRRGSHLLFDLIPIWIDSGILHSCVDTCACF